MKTIIAVAAAIVACSLGACAQPQQVDTNSQAYNLGRAFMHRCLYEEQRTPDDCTVRLSEFTNKMYPPLPPPTVILW